VSETVYVAYVTDESRVLEGVVDLKSLLFASPDDKIGDIMNPNVIFGYTHDDREKVANLISHYDILALPIVDNEKRLVGLVTVDDALDVLETEATEDIEKMAAILPTDKPYMKTGVFETWKKRIPWLLILMISATFTGAIITHYEAAIGTYAILTAFFPMLMDTGGNAGGQTSVTVIRGLSLGEIELRDAFRVLWKELRVATLCGLTLSAVTFVKVMAIDFRFQATSVMENGALQNNLLIAAIISLTVFSAILVAKTVGTLLPIGAKRIGLDPAVMASPFITTIVDTVTLFIYFTVASAWLPL
jgi:magnesium transporter